MIEEKSVSKEYSKKSKKKSKKGKKASKDVNLDDIEIQFNDGETGGTGDYQTKKLKPK